MKKPFTNNPLWFNKQTLETQKERPKNYRKSDPENPWLYFDSQFELSTYIYLKRMGYRVEHHPTLKLSHGITWEVDLWVFNPKSGNDTYVEIKGDWIYLPSSNTARELLWIKYNLAQSLGHNVIIMANSERPIHSIIPTFKEHLHLCL